MLAAFGFFAESQYPHDGGAGRPQALSRFLHHSAWSDEYAHRLVTA